MDGTEDDLLWNTNDDAEADSPDSDWDPYDQSVNNETWSILAEFLDSDEETSDFEGFEM